MENDVPVSERGLTDQDVNALATVLAHTLVDEYFAYVERPPEWSILERLMEDWSPPVWSGRP
jgi:hypothetical protein